MDPVELRNYFLLAIAAGILLIMYGVHLYRKARAQKYWPTTEGEIIVSEVIKTSVDIPEHHRVSYTPNIIFKYSVYDNVYESDKISLSKFSKSGHKNDAEKMIARYPLNEKVTVYYDPKNPATGILVPGKLTDITTAFALGIALIIGGIAGAINVSEYID